MQSWKERRARKWRRRWNNFKGSGQRWLQAVEPYTPAFVLLLLWLGLLIWLRPYFGDVGTVAQGVYIEAWGTVFDLFFVAILLYWFESRRHRKQQIERYVDEIDDFKQWDNDEARVRIAGNLRRLAGLGKTDFDLGGIILREFSFHANRVHNLRGTSFASGNFSVHKTSLTRVNFVHTDCTGVIFSRAVFGISGTGTVCTDLHFPNITLVNAVFDGAIMEWTEVRADEDDWYEDDGGERHQVYGPPFEEANLAGASFKGVKFKNADFRYAERVEFADFTDAEGLETCIFDEGIREKIGGKPNAIVVAGEPHETPVIITWKPETED